MSASLAGFEEKFGPANWTSLLAGWRGFGQHRRLVTLQEIDRFASEKLMHISDPSPAVVDLINISDSEIDQVETRLSKLAEQGTATYEREVQKWVVCLLEERLRELPSDPLDGLLALTEFWCDIDFPAYSPHQAQGQGNNLRPENYYTIENYQKILGAHREWIEKITRELNLN